MEIFGSTFDDSVFEESRNKDSIIVLSSYEPKTCESEWFCHHEQFEDVLDEQKTMKFRADLKYRKKEYQGAIDDYTSCLPLVQNNNLSMKRDLLEGITRCYSHLGNAKQALKTCEQLRKESSNTCHLTSVLQLELSIHQQSVDLISSIDILQQMCSLHPYNPWNWLQLATSYQTYLQSFSISSQDVEDTPEQDITYQHEKEALQLKACMCFVRTRHLIDILRTQQFSFVLEKSTRTLQVVEEALQELQIKEQTLQTVSKVMAEDLNPEKMREENQDGEGLSGLTVKAFDERWWNKLHSRLRT